MFVGVHQVLENTKFWKPTTHKPFIVFFIVFAVQRYKLFWKKPSDF